jgi:catechol 2,3-dioxygenase-like lactoylglutathione lyase family enzyme
MICFVTVRTSKLNESVAFYEWLLDLPVASRRKYPDTEIVFMGGGETQYEFIADADAAPVNGASLSVGFLVADLQEKLNMLDERNIAHTDIISPGPNIRFAFFTDLNGVRIQLVEGE